jgi:acyl transferase domain-containing protein
VERSSDDVEGFLCAHLAKKMGIAPDQVNCEATFSELGFDSSGLLSLLQEIEAQIGVELSPVLLFEYRTLKGLAEHLATYQEANFQPPASSGESPATLAAEQAAPRPAAEQPSVRAQEQRPSVRSAARTADSPRQVPRADVPDGSRANGRDIAIIGIDGKFPGAESVEDLWEVLKAGKDCITEIPQERWDYRKYRSYEEYCRWGAIEFCHCGGFIDDVDKFDAAFFNIQPLHADCMDPQQRLFMETVWRLLERAGYTRQRLREDHNGRVGVYVGSMYRDYSHVESDIAQELGSFLGFHSSIANRVSHFFDLSGPSLALDAMCASSAVAIHTACRDLRSGDCELAIVGGTNLSLHHKKFIALSHGRQIGTHAGSRSFSSADGYLPAEAIGAVLLKPLEKAIEGRDHILGVIRSTAVNQSGRSNGYTVPNPSAQAQVIEQCLAEAGADPRTVSYVEATSSGSSLGDPIELVALHRVFSKHAAARQSCPIGTVKSNIGHAEAASTMTQLAKVMLQFEHRQLPPSIKVEPLNPLAEWADTAFHLVHELQEWRPPVVSIGSGQRCYPRRAILNSFGAGGTNVSMLLEEFAAAPVDERRRDEPNERAEIIVFSARAADRLPWMLRQTLEHLRLNPQLSLEDIAYTSQLGREAMEARLALVVSSREELITVLEKSASFDPEDERSAPANLPLFFSGRKQTARGGSASAKSDKALIEMLIKENDAYRLSLLWTQGATIPWRLLHADSTAKIVPLPTYPFRKERHWLPLREHTREIDVLDKPRSAAADSAPSSDAQALIRSIELNVGRRNGVAPRNKVERAIADIWEEVLGIEDIGVTDNFFELGGDSMSAGLVIARCAEMFNVDIDWMILLGQEPTISTFAVTIVSKLANGMNEQELEAALAT